MPNYYKIVNVTLLRDGSELSIPVTLLKNESLAIPVVGVVKNAKPIELKKYNFTIVDGYLNCF